MVTQWSRLPWNVTYLARRTAGASLALAEHVGVVVFPSAPPHDAGWAAGYAAGVLDGIDRSEPLVTTSR